MGIRMYSDPSKVLVCSPQILLTPNWIATIKQYYGDRAILYIHESQQEAMDPRKRQCNPHMICRLPTLVYVEESDPDLLAKADVILTASDEQWVVILGRQTERLRALHRFLAEKN